ncbi:MAG: carboxypeptidase M32, partial [Pseudomonadota bacterium]
MTAIDDLLAFQRETEALGQVMGRLGWDQETMMPGGAIEQRAEEMAALDGVLHSRKTDPRIGDWLATAEAADDVQTRMLDLIRRRYERTQKVPAKLSAALARTTSLAHRVWAEARAENDFAKFAPMLKEVVDLSREKASALQDGGTLYDA